MQCLGGDFQGRLKFRNEEERARATRMGLKDLDKKSFNVRPEKNVVKVESALDDGPKREIDWGALDLKNLLAGSRILLVEDSEDNQEIFEHFLRSAGADVMIADDGEKAVDQAFRYNPDLILMDIPIPKFDGREATKRIRQKGFTRSVIALTAHALHEELQSCLEAGCNGQITKPVSGELLVQEVYFYLNHKV